MNEKATKQPARAQDPRPARTRAAILDAVERLGAKGQELSVSGIVAEAGLSRSSFYSQFKDLGDIAVQLMQEIFDRIVEARAELADGPRNEFQTTTTLLLEEFSRRRALYAATLGPNLTTSSTIWEVSAIMSAGAFEAVKNDAPKNVDVQVAARFIATGYLANIVYWLSSDEPGTIEELETQLRDLLPDWVTGTKS